MCESKRANCSQELYQRYQNKKEASKVIKIFSIWKSDYISGRVIDGLTNFKYKFWAEQAKKHQTSSTEKTKIV